MRREPDVRKSRQMNGFEKSVKSGHHVHSSSCPCESHPTLVCTFPQQCSLSVHLQENRCYSLRVQSQETQTGPLVTKLDAENSDRQSLKGGCVDSLLRVRGRWTPWISLCLELLYFHINFLGTPFMVRLSIREFEFTVTKMSNNSDFPNSNGPQLM